MFETFNVPGLYIAGSSSFLPMKSLCPSLYGSQSPYLSISHFFILSHCQCKPFLPWLPHGHPSKSPRKLSVGLLLTQVMVSPTSFLSLRSTSFFFFSFSSLFKFFSFSSLLHIHSLSFLLTLPHASSHHQGYVIGSSIKSMPLAGRTVTQFVQQLMRDRGESVPPSQSLHVARHIKERFSYVCPSLVKEFARYDEDTTGKWFKVFEVFSPSLLPSRFSLLFLHTLSSPLTCSPRLSSLLPGSRLGLQAPLQSRRRLRTFLGPRDFL